MYFFRVFLEVYSVILSDNVSKIKKKGNFSSFFELLNSKYDI